MSNSNEVVSDEYCGFLCSDVKERQKAIIQDIKDFAEYNDREALRVLMDLYNMCAQGIADIAKIGAAKKQVATTNQ